MSVEEKMEAFNLLYEPNGNITPIFPRCTTNTYFGYRRFPLKKLHDTYGLDVNDIEYATFISECLEDYVYNYLYETIPFWTQWIFAGTLNTLVRFIEANVDKEAYKTVWNLMSKDMAFITNLTNSIVEVLVTMIRNYIDTGATELNIKFASNIQDGKVERDIASVCSNFVHAKFQFLFKEVFSKFRDYIIPHRVAYILDNVDKYHTDLFPDRFYFRFPGKKANDAYNYICDSLMPLCAEGFQEYYGEDY